MYDVRMVRQQQLISETAQNATIMLVGLGMLGSWTAHTLARMVARVHGYDFDTVGAENIGTQAYSLHDSSCSKSEALMGSLYGLAFAGHPERFGPLTPVPSGAPNPLVVISAVDSFEGRRMVAEWAQKRCADLFIDTRAHGTVGVVLVVAPNQLATYLETLESDDGAPIPACGTEGTAFVGMWVASQVASLINRYCAGLPTPHKQVYDVGMDDRLMLGWTAGKGISMAK